MNNKFVFIAPMFNASQTLERMLHSLFGQSYDNWELILIDDISSESELNKCNNIVNNFVKLNSQTLNVGQEIIFSSHHGIQFSKSKHIKFIVNKRKFWEVENVLQGLKLCNDDDIICRIDADDWLVDLDALSIINHVYNATKCDTLWTKHRWSFSDKNISSVMSNDADPYKHPWVTSHLKTFRKKLINDVPDINFRRNDGNYIRRAGDQAIYLPVLHHSKNRVFLPRVMYHYTISDVPETYQTDDAKFQRDEAISLRERGYIS